MKLIVVISLLMVIILPQNLKYVVTICMTLIWAIYTIYHFIKLMKSKDKKIITSEYSTTAPNNDYSAHIRYLYNKKVDYKAFVSTIMELLLKNYISIGYDNNDYYIVDNKVKDEVLSKNEEYAKKILFSDITDNSEVSLNYIMKKCSKNSGYIYSVYKEWKNTLEVECAYNKYFKSNKSVIDNSLSYFAISFIISLYNIFFTKLILVAIFILLITGILCKYVNDIVYLEEDKKEEYKEWLKFKNYIRKYDNSLDELDNLSLENYSTYAYVLDELDSFIKILNRKSSKNKDIFNDSILLTIINLKIFNEIDKAFKKSIIILNIKSRFLFAKNKGRR